MNSWLHSSTSHEDLNYTSWKSSHDNSSSSGKRGAPASRPSQNDFKKSKTFVSGTAIGGKPLLPKKQAASISADNNDKKSISLSKSQKQVIDKIMARQSVFFSGAAGSGKSFLLKVLRDIFNLLDKDDAIVSYYIAL